MPPSRSNILIIPLILHSSGYIGHSSNLLKINVLLFGFTWLTSNKVIYLYRQ